MKSSFCPRRERSHMSFHKGWPLMILSLLLVACPQQEPREQTDVRHAELVFDDLNVEQARAAMRRTDVSWPNVSSLEKTRLAQMSIASEANCQLNSAGKDSSDMCKPDTLSQTGHLVSPNRVATVHHDIVANGTAEFIEVRLGASDAPSGIRTWQRDPFHETIGEEESVQLPNRLFQLGLDSWSRPDSGAALREQLRLWRAVLDLENYSEPHQPFFLSEPRKDIAIL